MKSLTPSRPMLLKRISLLFVLFLVFAASPAHAQGATPQPVVRAVLFTNPLCAFCRQIVEGDLPPVVQRFGSQLQILSVDVNTAEGDRLFRAAYEALGIPRGTPMLFVGQKVLGGVNIPKQLPDLVDTYLAQGGQDWPVIPGFDEYLAASQAAETSSTANLLPGATVSPSPEIPTPLPGQSALVVQAVMFWQAGCPHCEETLNVTLPPIREKYGAQFDLRLIEIVNLEDVDQLYKVAASYGLSKEQTGVPFLIIGKTPLIGSDNIRDKLPALIDQFLAQGGVGIADALLARLPTANPDSLATPGQPAVAPTPVPAENTPQSNGFALAIVILVGMALALFYSLAALVLGKTFSLPAWSDWLIPVIILIGMGVAGYLTVVETQSVTAMCGPVGDCHAVQSSKYATLFGILPVGVLGLLGYLGLLAAWLARKTIPKLEKLAAAGFFGLAFFGVSFSLYLTYLEPFVIKAVCVWCLTSAVLVTLLLLLSLPPAVRLFSTSNNDAE